MANCDVLDAMVCTYFTLSGILTKGIVLLFAAIVSKLIFVSVKRFTLSSSLKRKDERKIDFFESVLDELHTLGGANMCCGLNLKSTSTLPYDHVCDALKCVSKKYPLLRTVIEHKKDGGNKAAKYLRVVNDKNMVTLNKSSIYDWVSVWEKEVQTKFDCEAGPLWHSTILQERYDPVKEVYNNTILFTFYHGVMDGLAVLKFTQEFVQCLENISKGILNGTDDVRSGILPGVLSLLSSRQFLHYKILQWLLPEWVLLHLVKSAMRINLMFDAKNPVLSQLPGNSSVGEANIKIIPRHLSMEHTQTLIRLCRRNGCTVYGAMLACCHIAVAKLIEDRKISETNKPVRFGWYCPVNVRDQCEPRIQEDDLGSYTTVLMENVDVPNISSDNHSKFWNFAKGCTHQVHSGIRNGHHLFSLYLLPISHLLDPKEFVSEFLLHSKMKQSELMSPVHSLTNLGRIEWRKEETDTYEIESVFGGSGAYQNGASFVNHMATFNGVFTWSTSYVTTRISEEKATKYVNLVFEILLNALSSSGDD